MWLLVLICGFGSLLGSVLYADFRHPFVGFWVLSFCKRSLSSCSLPSLTRIRFNFEAASSHLVSSQKQLYDYPLAKFMLFFRDSYTSLYQFHLTAETDFRYALCEALSRQLSLKISFIIVVITFFQFLGIVTWKFRCSLT